MIRRRLKEGGLAWHMFAQAIVPSLIIVLGMILLTAQMVSSSMQRALDERLVLAQSLAGRLDDYLQQTIRTAEMIISLSWPEDPALSTPADLERSVRATRNYLGSAAYYVVLVSPERQVLAVDPVVPEALTFDWTQAKCVASVFATGKPLVTSSFVLGTPTPTVAMVVPVRAPDGRVAATMFVALNLNDTNFTNMIDLVRLGQTGYAEVVDSSAVILGATRPHLRWQTDDHQQECSMMVQEGEPWAGTCHSCHTEDGMAVRQFDVMAFAPMKVGQWGVAIRQSQGEVFAQSYALRNRAVVFVGLAAIGAVLTSSALARRLVRPIRNLTKSCQAIANGNLEEPIPPAGVAEVHVLAAAFDHMRNRLKTSLDEIRAGQAVLEERVQQRTSQLIESQQQLVVANRELTTLNAVGEALRGTLDVQGTLSSALETVVRCTAATSGSICLYDRRHKRLSSTASWPPGASCGCCCSAERGCALLAKFTAGQSAGVFSCRQADCDQGGCLKDQRQVQPMVCTPLIANGQALGMMVVRYQGEAVCTDRERDLLISIGRQIGMGAENALLFRELQDKEEARGHLLRQVIGAQEEERRRIARELHDETSQALTALSLGIETSIMAPATRADDVKRRLFPLKDMAKSMLVEIQRMIKDLRPSLLDDLGLISAIDWYAEARLKSQGISVEWEVIGAERRLSTEIETVVFRLAQEAISNAARHAAPKMVHLRLEFEPGQLGLTVIDDGCGFDAPTVLADPAITGAYGLAGMRERVSLLGGTLAVESTPRAGTQICVRIPLNGTNGAN